MAAKRKTGRRKGQLTRRRSTAAYRRAGQQERVKKVQSAIEAALAESARLREEISRKIEQRGAPRRK